MSMAQSAMLVSSGFGYIRRRHVWEGYRVRPALDEPSSRLLTTPLAEFQALPPTASLPHFIWRRAARFGLS